jgi:hypothetical protein
MKYALKFISSLFYCFWCCSNNTTIYTPATDALDAAREFVTACQQGNFIKANFYMIANEKNKTLLQEAEQTFRELPAAKRKAIFRSFYARCYDRKYYAYRNHYQL